MTLYRQLALAIIIVFIAGLLGTLAISTGNLRQFLAEQLETQAQDTATALGLSLSRPMQDNDLPVMNTMVDAVFDRGYYQSIIVAGSDGKILIERHGSAEIPGVPDWFRRNIRLEVPEADAQVMSGWKPAATVRVASHPGHAYRELWRNTIETFRLYLLAILTSLVLGLVAVRQLLKPLRGVESQAGEICSGNYPVQEKLPHTRELRSVVTAMNRLALRVKETFTEQSAMTESLLQQSFMDTLTGLGNRRYFERQLRNHLVTNEESSAGTLILLELNHLERVNSSSGFQAGDRLLRRTGELIRQHAGKFANCEVARISGAGFAIIAIGLSQTVVVRLADGLISDLIQLHGEHLVEHTDIAAIGIANWVPGDTVSGVLSKVDMALRSARSNGDNTWSWYERGDSQPDRQVTGQWRTFLGEVIQNQRAVLFAQPVFGLPDDHRRILHQEIFLRVRHQGGDLMTAGMFMPVAEYTGLATDLDRLAIGMLLEHIRLNPASGSAWAINLTSSSLHDPDFLQWLSDKLAACGHCAPRLAFEIPETGILQNISSAHAFIERVKTFQCSCGIDHFGHGFHSFGYLAGIGVSYLKIDRSYIRSIDSDGDNRFLVKTLNDAAHSIGLRVIAGGVETREELTTLEMLGIDGVQGYAMAKPESLHPAHSGILAGDIEPAQAEITPRKVLSDTSAGS